jgi:hypothetical protein
MGRERKMKFVQWVLAGCAAGTLLGFGAARAGAIDVDLSGTWTGTAKCTKFIGKNLRVPSEDVALTISQSASSLIMRLDDSGGSTFFQGVVFEGAHKPDEPAKRGAVAFADCGTSSDLTGSNSLGQAQVTTKRGGRFVGTRVHAEGTGQNQASWVETCRLKFKRMNTDTGNVVSAFPSTCGN